MLHATPIVFVVDDDVSVRKSLELLIDSAGWQPETFAVRAGVPAPPTGRCPKLPGTRHEPSGP